VGADYVFVVLPCAKEKVDFSSVLNTLKKNPNNKYYAIKVEEHDASIYQPASNANVANFEAKEAYKTLAYEASSNAVERRSYIKAIFLAESLFARRAVQNRHLIIKTCGNCMPYSIIDSLKVVKALDRRNIVVSSFGDYPMENTDSTEEEDEAVIGYNSALENVFLYNGKAKSADADNNLDGYNFEHKGDLCHRMAIKTRGNVLDVNYFQFPKVLEKLPKWLEESNRNNKSQIKGCDLIDNYFGTDIADFTFKQL